MNYVKCVVWDLDNTLWDGVLLEDAAVDLRPQRAAAVRELDERGILQSIASRNDHAAAIARLADFGLDQYFLHPQIHWDSKAASVRQIARRLNIGLDGLAFIDDDPFERDEVQFACPEVRCYDAAEVPDLLALPEMNPRFVTEDARLRRQLYAEDARRSRDESQFQGPAEQFLRGLGLRFSIRPAGEGDLRRAEELTIRTHQLNATGCTYSYDQLEAIRTSPDHMLLVASLSDRYGSYGTIGLALLETGRDDWILKLLLMSCRVASRGVGAVFLGHLANRARAAGARLLGEFLPGERNQAMYLTYRLGGFRRIGERGPVQILEADLSEERQVPAHIELVVEGGPG